MHALRRAGPILVAITVVVAILGALVASSVRDARLALLSARDELAGARTTMLAKDDDASQAMLDRIDTRMVEARAAVHRFPLGIVKDIPLLGSPVRAVDDATEAGKEGVAAGRLLADALAKFPTRSGTVGVDGHDLSALHDASSASRQALEQAREHVTAAGAALDGPSGSALPVLSGPAREMRKVILDTERQLDGADRGLQLLGHLTDADTTSRVLVLSQDSLELRPTGGFIGSWGVITFANGTVELERFDSFEALPAPSPPMTPPPGLAEALPRWWGLSNVNWWPDFPTTAKTAREMFRRQGGGQVDAVLAITEHLMAKLVGVLGPIKLADYAEPVVEKGFDQRVLYEVELKQPYDEPRKKFLIDLSEEVFDRLFRLEPAKLPAVADVFDAAVGAGDVQLWFADPAHQRLIAETAWSGRLPKTSGDFLMVVDANLSASKSNSALTRDITYQVKKDSDGTLWSDLRIVMHNDGTSKAVNPLYNGFVRVYAPKGAKLLDTRGGQHDDGVAPDGNYQVFSSSVVVDPGTTEELSFRYELPSIVLSDPYHLTWLRQVGTPRDKLSASIDNEAFVATPQVRALQIDAGFAEGGLTGWLRRRWVVRKLGW